MERTKIVNRTIWIIVLCIISILICYFFVDKQLALWVSQHHLRTIKILKYLSKLPELYIVAAVIIYFYIAIRCASNRWTLKDQSLLMFANVIAITHFLKDFFKFVFGRTWPETWIHNNPSLIHDHVYRFNCFTSDNTFGAFPSGHAAILIAGTTFLWLTYPRWKIGYSLLILLAIIGIQTMNYHFVGDIIAGGLLGYLVALFARLILKTKL